MIVNFNIDDIFNKIEEDDKIIDLFSKYDITYDENYKNEVTKRIQKIYENDFNLYTYWMGEEFTNEISIDLNEIDTFDLINISDGTFRIELQIGDNEDEIYEQEYSNIDFFSLSEKIYSGTADGISTDEIISDSTANFSNININNYIIKITSGTNKNIYKKILSISETKLKTEQFSSSNANEKYEIIKLPTISNVVNYLTLKIQNESEIILIKDKIKFLYNNNLILYMDEILEETRKISLTISNSNLVGYKLNNILGFDSYGTTVTSKQNLIETFLNNEESGYSAEYPPWISNYLGFWNSSTNTPTLSDGVGNNFDYYKINVAGSTLIDSISNWYVNDIIYFYNGKWLRNPEIYNFSNFDLILYVFYLDDVYNNNIAKYNLCKRLIYHFKYTGTDWFFYKNYNRFMSDYDYEQIKSKPKMRVFIESLLTEIDRLSKVVNDINNLKNRFNIR